MTIRTDVSKRGTLFSPLALAFVVAIALVATVTIVTLFPHAPTIPATASPSATLKPVPSFAATSTFTPTPLPVANVSASTPTAFPTVSVYPTPAPTIERNETNANVTAGNASAKSALDASYKTGLALRLFRYKLRGNNRVLQIQTYAGLSEELAAQPRVLTAPGSVLLDTQIRAVFEKGALGDPSGANEITPIARAIEYVTVDKDDQARIAISVVQHIPYDFDAASNGNVTERFPYEVLYDARGVCGEKSRLLAFLLKELGFGVALLVYPHELHEAVGIQCPLTYSLNQTGYCFVETTSPSIVTDDQGTYVDVGKLAHDPVITKISDGLSFNTVDEEAKDAKDYRRILSYHQTTLNNADFARLRNIVNKYGLLGITFEGYDDSFSFTFGPQNGTNACFTLPLSVFNAYTQTQLEHNYCNGTPGCFYTNCWTLTDP